VVAVGQVFAEPVQHRLIGADEVRTHREPARNIDLSPIVECVGGRREVRREIRPFAVEVVAFPASGLESAPMDGSAPRRARGQPQRDPPRPIAGQAAGFGARAAGQGS
jgi:hypothetical protein